MPKVSVIIPTRNRRVLLTSAINSVMVQTFQDFEIIVVDDGSEDNTREIVEEMESKKIRYISHEIQKGEAASRNTGIMNATGDFIAFLDDDDEWLPEKLSLQIELLEKREENVGAIYTGYLFINMENKRVFCQKRAEVRGDISKDLLCDNVIGTPSSVLLRKQVINRIGLFDEKLPYYVDYDFFIRISKHFHFEYINRPLVKYHVHQEMLSKDPYIMLQGLEKLLEKYSNNKGDKVSNRFIGKQYTKIGKIFYNNENYCHSRKTFKKSILWNPFQYKGYLFLLSSFVKIDNFYKVKPVMNKLQKHLNSIKVRKLL